MSESESIDIGVKAGDVLAGKYQVEQILGVGGMGVVVAAHHIQLDQKVALKFLLPEAPDEPPRPWPASRCAKKARAAVERSRASTSRG